MKTYQPKDEQLLSWDPENLEEYWEQCQKYDRYPEIKSDTAELISQYSFQKEPQTKLRK